MAQYSIALKQMMGSVEVGPMSHDAGLGVWTADIAVRQPDERGEAVTTRVSVTVPEDPAFPDAEPGERECMAELMAHADKGDGQFDVYGLFDAFGVPAEERDRFLGDIRIMSDADYLADVLEDEGAYWDRAEAVTVSDSLHQHAEAVLAGEVEPAEASFGEHVAAQRLGRALAYLDAMEHEGESFKGMAEAAFYEAYEATVEDVHVMGRVVDAVPRFTGDVAVDAKSLTDLARALPSEEALRGLAHGYVGGSGAVRDAVLACGCEVLVERQKACEEETQSLYSEMEAVSLSYDADDEELDEEQERIESEIEALEGDFNEMSELMDSISPAFDADVVDAYNDYREAEAASDEAKRDHVGDRPAPWDDDYESKSIDFSRRVEEAKVMPSPSFEAVAEKVASEKDARIEQAEDEADRNGFDLAGISSADGMSRGGKAHGDIMDD